MSIIVLIGIMAAWVVLGVVVFALCRTAARARDAVTDDERREQSQLLALEQAWRVPSGHRRRRRSNQDRLRA